MKKLKVALFCAFSFVAGGAFVGITNSTLHDLLRGSAKTMVLTSDVDFAERSGDDCPGRAEGGLRAGTVVQVRRKGPFHSITYEANVVDLQFPARVLEPDEIETAQRLQKCVGYPGQIQSTVRYGATAQRKNRKRPNKRRALGFNGPDGARANT